MPRLRASAATVCGADHDAQVGVDSVVRDDGGVAQGDRAGVAAAVGRHGPRRGAGPHGDGLGLGDEDGRRRHALGQGRRQRERLEGRTRLAAALHGDVELLAAEVAAADEGLDLPGTGIDRDDGDHRVVGLIEDRRGGGIGGALHVAVEGGVDAQTAAEGAGGAEALDELLDHVLDEVRGDVAAHDGVRPDGEGRGGGGGRSRRRHVALLHQRVEHELPPLPRRLRVLEGVVIVGIPDHAGEQRRLCQGEPRGPGAEERPGGHLHAVGTLAEVDRVEVVGEYLVLRPAFLELVGQDGLADLAAQRLLGRFVGVDIGVLDELLRDRRPALHRVSRTHIGQEGACDGVVVDPLVAVEALVLDGHDGLLHDLRDLARGDDDTALVAL